MFGRHATLRGCIVDVFVRAKCQEHGRWEERSAQTSQCESKLSHGHNGFESKSGVASKGLSSNMHAWRATFSFSCK